MEDTLVDEKNLFNFTDHTNHNTDKLPYNHRIPGPIEAAHAFLTEFVTYVTLRDKDSKGAVKKKCLIYNDIINSFAVFPLKLIDIDYNHFVDWVNIYFGKMMDICKAHETEYPYIPLDQLADYELNDVCVYIYCSQLLNYVEKDKVERFQTIMKKAVLQAYQKVDLDLDLDLDNTKDIDKTKAFLNLHVGIKNLPNEQFIYQIKSDYINKGVVIKGDLVSYDDKARVEIIKSKWYCGQCEQKFYVNNGSKPLKCGVCGQRGVFEDMDEYTHTDYIYIKVQQHMNSHDIQIGITDLTVKLEGSNLIEHFYQRMKPAANLKITGVIKLSSEKTNKNNPNERLLQLHALSVDIEGENVAVKYNDRLLDLIASRVKQSKINVHYDKLKRSICPHIYGREPQKAAVLLQCVGATPRIDRITRSRIRGDIHLLFCGDPGTAKSEFGNFILKILPQSIRTIGGKATTTKAALTTSSDIVNNVRVVTFGVLPRCDNRGTAVIDELDKRDTEDMQVLSIPMDDLQVIPTHKSGFSHNVMARCPVYLAGNATKNHGRWDPSKTIDEQTNYAQWLLSRIDLVFVMIDDNDMNQKELMVEHMAKSRGQMIHEADFDKMYKNKSYSETSLERIEQDLSNDKFDGVYDTEYLRHEIHWLKMHYKPTIKSGSPAEQLLKKEYLRFSQISIINSDEETGLNQSVMDARAYNGLERISMAIARCRRHHFVEMEDMEEALSLMMASITSMIPQVRQSGDKLSNDVNLHRQLSKMLNDKDGIRGVLEEQNRQHNKIRDQTIKQYTAKMNTFMGYINKVGFYDCLECKGKGKTPVQLPDSVTYEECPECKGKERFNRDFTFLDLQTQIINSGGMKKEEIKPWFDKFVSKKIIRAIDRSKYGLTYDRIDKVVIGEFVRKLATLAADQYLEAEKEKYDNGAGGIGPGPGFRRASEL
jgi:replicative DNA helicase Mcm